MKDYNLFLNVYVSFHFFFLKSFSCSSETLLNCWSRPLLSCWVFKCLFPKTNVQVRQDNDESLQFLHLHPPSSHLLLFPFDSLSCEPSVYLSAQGSTPPTPHSPASISVSLPLSASSLPPPRPDSLQPSQAFYQTLYCLLGELEIETAFSLLALCTRETHIHTQWALPLSSPLSLRPVLSHSFSPNLSFSLSPSVKMEPCHSALTF